MKIEFINGIPSCPVLNCGSYRFNATFFITGPGEWRIEIIYCDRCNTEIEVTQEFEEFLRSEKWEVRKE